MSISRHLSKLRNLIQSDAVRLKASRRYRSSRLLIEPLEDRRLLTTIDLAALVAGQGSTIFGADANDGSGFSVRSAGDVNGDGFDDLFIGAYRADASGNTKSDAGESYVIFGRAALPATIDLATLGSAGITIFGAEVYDTSSFSVSSAGDVNGDGFDDLLIGAYRADASGNRKSSAGDSYVIFGRAALPATIDLATPNSAGITIFGADASDYSGRSVSSAGDVNGDGFDDLLIGARSGDASGNAKSDAGESYLIFGGAALPATIDLTTLGSAGITIFGTDANDGSGWSVSSGGDVNGDGFDDLLIGAYRADASDNAKSNAGESYVIFGGTALPAAIDLATLGSAGITIFGVDAADGSGGSVSKAGDVNGDGFDDLLIEAMFADASGNAKSGAGDSYVIFGGDSLPTMIDLATLGSAGITISGADTNDFSGWSVSSAGDVNGDGFDDLIIGAPFADASGNSKSDAGESYLVFGGTSLPATIDLATLGSAGITIFGADAVDGSGWSVSSAGDVNGDGFDDFLIGAFHGDASGNTKANSGESYILFGGDFTGSMTHPGTASSQTLTGTAGADVMIGGRGHDILIGDGGLDVLRGGEGDDILAISDLTFKRLVGGTGMDTVRLDGSGLSLNLTTLRDNRLLGIEQINLTGSGNNTLTLNQREVLNISDESNTLIVRRNTGDVVSIVDIDSWTQAANETLGSDAFRVYTQGTATLKVQEQSGDVVAPTIVALGPTDNAVNVAVAANLVLTFGENVQKGAGNLLIKRMSDNTTFATIPVTDAQVSVSGAIVTINPPANLNSGTSYYLQIAAGAFEDTAGNDFAGIFDNSTWNFATATTQSLVVSSTAVSVPEGGTNTFTVKLNAQPAANVTVNVVRASGDTNLTVSGGASLTFTTANWNTPQTITLAAAEDADLANGAAVFNVTSTGLTAVVVTATEADNDSGPTNVAPVIGAFDTTVSYTENAVPILIDANATVIDVDSANFAGGKLTVAVSANGQTTDRIGIRNVGNLAGQIGISSTTVSYAGVAIGTFAGTTSLVVTLNDKATPAAVQALLRSVTFTSLSENPSVLVRTIKVTLTDGDGGTSNMPTKLVKVAAVNDAPVIAAFDTTMTYVENAVPLLIDSNATVIDVDSANFAGGKLTVSVSANGQTTDRIGIRNSGSLAGQIGISSTTVSYGGVVIGTFAGTTSLVVTLNDKATPAAVQALLRSVTFTSLSENPSVLVRTIKVTLTDGDGGISNVPTKLVKVAAVNDAPVIAAFDTTMTYVENAVPLLIDSNATVIDLDSANFASGKLTVAVSANSQTTDRIGIKHVGNLAGQIGVSGTTISYGGVAIGTFAGTTSLVVTLNDKATPAAVQALLRSVTFSSLSENPSVLDRTIKVTATDGDGGTSNLPTKLVKVVAVNDAPVIGAFDTTVNYVASGAAVVLDGNATVTDVDSVNLAGGKLTVVTSTNGQTTDRVEIRNEGTGIGKIGVSGLNVTYGGVVIGGFSGTTSLSVTLNAAVTPAAVQALLRNITFRSTSATPSTATRTIRVSLTDGDGGTSNLPTKTVMVSTGVLSQRASRTNFVPELSDLDLAFSGNLIETDLLVS